MVNLDLGKVRMRNITMNLPAAYVERLDRLVELGLAPSRSAVIRYALELYVDREIKMLDLLEVKQRDETVQT